MTKNNNRLLLVGLAITIILGIFIRDRLMIATINNLKQDVISLNAQIKQQKGEIYDLNREKTAFIKNVAISNNPAIVRPLIKDEIELNSEFLASGSATIEDYIFADEKIKLIAMGGLTSNNLPFGVQIFQLPKKDLVIYPDPEGETNRKELKPRLPLTPTFTFKVFKSWGELVENFNQSFTSQTGVIYYQADNPLYDTTYFGYYHAKNFSYLVTIFYQPTGIKEKPSLYEIKTGAKKIADSFSQNE